MSEMSDMHKLIMAMKLAKTAQVGMELTYFDVIELLGELDSLKSYIAELEAECDRAKAIVSRLRDFLFDYTNLKISNSQDDRWWALVDKFDELTTESER